MLLKNIYRIIPREHAILFKDGYHLILKQYLKLFYLLKYGKTDMFNDINVETITSCNRRCEYCPNSIFDRSLKQNEELMHEELFKNIIDNLKSINFTGRISPHFYGEPLLDRRLMNLMKYAYDTLPRAKLVIYTNGDLLDLNTLKNLYEVGVRDYVITLHGENTKELNKNRIINLKNDMRKNRMGVHINFIEINYNSWLSNRGGLVKIKNVSKNIHCQDSTNPLVINYKGDVLLCCNDYLGRVKFGNVTEHSLLEIWDRESFKKVRKEIKNKIFKLDICKKCVGDTQ